MNNIRHALRILKADAKRYKKFAQEAEATGSRVPIPVKEDETIDEVTEVGRERFTLELLSMATAFQVMADKLKATMARLEKL